ncbi:hypothetical protein WA026_000628 [Henosepilachna vigintioctopunctata]|uniref:RanBP-type and C3HC4-type zinc finger-containing protein 1 n=1 Tax=Henosepilachna vigintioctopunctata TaxID=420089 RepID=A0AAW1V7U8_9CUCU
MIDNDSESTLENGKQSLGKDSKSAKRNSGLFSFFKWLKPSGSASRESLNTDKAIYNSSSCESLSSVQSFGTVASFSFVEPSAYAKNFTQKSITETPETDTYKERLKQRDKRREKDKNITLRKKYNLFFNRDTLLKSETSKTEESTKSLPLMTKPTMKEEPREENFHRRTNSESSKIKKAGAYIHVKGKRKAPQPPGSFEDNSTASLRRKNKRLAPPPPALKKEKPESPLLQKFRSNLASSAQKEEVKMESIETTYSYEQFEYISSKNNAYKPESPSKGENSSKNYSVDIKKEDSDLSQRSKAQSNIKKKITDNSKTISEFSEAIYCGKEEVEPVGSPSTENKETTNNLAKKHENETTHNVEESKKFNLKESDDSDVISNDFLKLDHGILKPVKENDQNIYSECSPFSCKDSSDDSKPWYKRQDTNTQLKREFFKMRQENKYEPMGILPEVSFNRNSTIDLSNEKTRETKKDEKFEKKKEDKRKSGLSLLANISELDREAAEILQKEKKINDHLQQIPEFMKMKEDNTKSDTNSWASPKRRSARDLIAKFNAITNVTKVTVNTALFGSSYNKDSKKDYFGKSTPKEKKYQEALLESHKKRIEMIDKKMNSDKKINNDKKGNIEKKVDSLMPLMKSESASVIKKPETPKTERKNWNCPKCYIENDYWRIICHVCSAIKPYFDDLAASPNLKKSEKNLFSKETDGLQNPYERVLERSKTQIGFSALANYNSKSNKKFEPLNDNSYKNVDKKEEKERLKKMLIEMKNSLPKKASSRKLTSRSSIIVEKPEMETKKVEMENPSEDSESSNTDNEDVRNNSPTLQCKDTEDIKVDQNIQLNDSEKVASILIGTKTTVYENIKVKKTDLKPTKVSSSVQTSPVVAKPPEPSKRVNVTAMVKKKNSFEPMKMQDFEEIYTDQDGKSAARIYANLAQNDELSMFFNMPKNLTEMKNTLSKMKLQNKSKDTIEINRLLRRLEVAIAKGDLVQAADFAKELAQLKVNCSVIRQRSGSEENEEPKGIFSVDMYVEDKISHRGPFPLRVTPEQTVGELKKQVAKEFDIPVNVQRWILGKELANEDSTTLKDNQITNGCPIFLYLVAPDNDQTKNISATETKSKETARLYPEVDLTISEIYSEKTEAPSATTQPKIIEAIPKNVGSILQSENVECAISSNQADKQSVISLSEENEKSSKDKQVENKPEKHMFNEVVTQTVTTVLYAPNLHLAKPEDIEDYDTLTLKPQVKEPEEWECHLCTLLNPMKSNICGVCATVRQNPPKKAERKKLASKANTSSASSSGQTYLQLMHLDNADLVHNSEPFDCLICFTEVPPKEGITLRECLHQFCKECLRHTIEFCDDAEVKCPYRDNEYSCNIALQDREIKALVTKDLYDQHLAKSVAQAENKMDKSFHCKTPDCRGWCVFEDNVNEFKCPVCRRVNCLTCQAIHMGLNCKQYQQRMTEESENDPSAKQTRLMLDEMVKNGEALKCPTCHVIMMKKWGCDWLRCSMCKTEICWVTRGPRWGPGGKGDTSGGCQCGVNGVKCHPKCNYCH